MEGRMNKGEGSEPVPTRIEGKCGHHQKLVGYRTKKLLTLFGKVKMKRLKPFLTRHPSQKLMKRRENSNQWLRIFNVSLLNQMVLWGVCVVKVFQWKIMNKNGKEMFIEKIE